MKRFTYFSIMIALAGVTVMLTLPDEIERAGGATGLVSATQTATEPAGRVSAEGPGRESPSTAQVDERGSQAAIPVITFGAAGADAARRGRADAGLDTVEDAKDARAAAQAKMSGPVAALAQSGGAAMAEIIVSYEDHPELFEQGRVEELGGEIVRSYGVLNLLAIRIPGHALFELASESDVERLSLNDNVAVSSVVSKAAANTPVPPSGNAYLTGSYKGIAIIDTGVSAHRDIRSDVLQFDFVGGRYPVPEIRYGQVSTHSADSRVDGFGHGTHVAGILAGSGYGSGGKNKGTATDAKLLSLRVLDHNGYGQVSDVVAALDWLLQYGHYFNIKVANLSLGSPITESIQTDPLVLAAEALWDSGIVVVVAAGNEGRNGDFTITSPANSRKVITVGSLTDNATGSDFSDDYASTFSSRGPSRGDFVLKPDLVAPGNRITSTMRVDSYLSSLLPERVERCTASSDWHHCDDYFMLSGTSMAAPLVSATVALMLEKEPSLTPSTVKARLMRSTRKVDASPIQAGTGTLDIEAALNETGTVPGQALSPLLVYDEATGSTLVQETGTLWGDAAWGLGFLWTDGGGTSANGFLWTDGPVDAKGFLWTDEVTFANGFLWTDGGSGVQSKGFLWTDGGVTESNGFLWTDGGTTRANALYDFESAVPAITDDAPSQ